MSPPSDLYKHNSDTFGTIFPDKDYLKAAKNSKLCKMNADLVKLEVCKSEVSFSA